MYKKIARICRNLSEFPGERCSAVRVLLDLDGGYRFCRHPFHTWTIRFFGYGHTRTLEPEFRCNECKYCNKQQNRSYQLSHANSPVGTTEKLNAMQRSSRLLHYGGCLVSSTSILPSVVVLELKRTKFCKNRCRVLGTLALY